MGKKTEPQKLASPELFDRLYTLGYQFKQTQVWNRCYEEYLYAVDLPSGRRGYCCIMGSHGQHRAMAVYLGDEGMASYWKISSPPNYERREPDGMCQRCLQCALLATEDLKPEEKQAVRSFLSRHPEVKNRSGLTPVFMWFAPYFRPADLDTQEDQLDLIAALEVTLQVAKELETKSLADLGMRAYSENMPLYVLEDGKYVRKGTASDPVNRYMLYQDLLEEVEKWLPEKLCKQVCALPTHGSKSKWNDGQAWNMECELCRGNGYVEDKSYKGPSEHLFFPAMFVAQDTLKDYCVVLKIAETPDYDPIDFIEELGKKLLQIGSKPQKIYVRNEETEAILHAFCEKTHIQLNLVGDLIYMPDVLSYMDDNLDDELGIDEDMLDQFKQFVDSLRHMSDIQLRQLDPVALDMLSSLYGAGLMDEKLYARLQRIFPNL